MPNAPLQHQELAARKLRPDVVGRLGAAEELQFAGNVPMGGVRELQVLAGNQAVSQLLSGMDFRAAANPPSRETSPAKSGDHQGQQGPQRSPSTSVTSASSGVGTRIPQPVDVAPVDDPLEQEASAVAGQTTDRLAAEPVDSTALAGIADGLGEGQPLDRTIRKGFEARLGTDLSNVRIHVDSAAQRSADRVKAAAYTIGDHIVFGHNGYAANTQQSSALLAHELTHVRQHVQRGQAQLMHRAPLKAATPPVAESTGPPISPPTGQNAQLPQSIVDLLRQTSEGQWALNVLHTDKVTLTLTKEGAPAQYDAHSNTCTLNVGLPAGMAASYFVHEMFHAQQANTGHSGDAQKMDEATFLRTMLHEETAGTAKGYQAFMELEKKQQIPPNAPRPPHYADFTRAYAYGRQQAQNKNPNASELDLHQAGLKNGEAMIGYWIEQGGLGVSDGRTYTQYYTKEWELVRKHMPNPGVRGTS